MNTILLSKYLWVNRADLEKKWVFDSVLWIDTKLFIDPKLLEKTSISELLDSRKDVLKYFKDLLNIIDKSSLSSQLKEIAISRLAVLEPKGLSIWYWNKTDKWTTIRRDVAIDIIKSAIEMMSVWIEDPELIELLSLFVKNFWADSLSDLTSHIIYDKLCEYTQRICKELSLKTEIFEYQWKEYFLPKHPFQDNQIIFLPIEILRNLPIATSWEEIDYVVSFNQKLRTKWNEIVRDIIINNSKKIKSDNVNIDKARQHFRELLEIYKNWIVDNYDINIDKKWYYDLPKVVDLLDWIFTKQSLTPNTTDDLISVVRNFLVQFKKAIEKNWWNKALYHKTSWWSSLPGKPHNEDVAQLLFYLLADQYCSFYNIMLSWESDAWRWPVDFALWVWYKDKVLVEIKKSTNQNILTWFNNQLEIYKWSESAVYWFYVIILLWDEDTEESNHVKNIKKAFPSWINSSWTSEIFIIDWRIYPSASKDKRIKNKQIESPKDKE